MTTQEEAEAALEPLVRQALDEYLTALRAAVLVDSVTAAAFLPDRWGEASRVWFDAIRRLVFPVVSDLFGEAFMAFARGAVISDIPYREAYLERVFSRLKLFPDNLFEDIRPEIAEAVAEGEPIDQIADRVEAFLDFDQAKDATGPDQAAARAARAEINEIERQLDDPATPSSELGELRRRRRDVYEREAEALDRYRYKAERIARTEAVAALNAGAFDGAAGRAAITGEVLYKEWLSTADDRTRESHVLANGQIRPMLAPFDVGGSPLMFPGDPTGPAQEVIQCRCTILIHDADELTGDQVDNLTAAVPEGAQLPDGWRGTLVPLNMPSGDGRTLMTPIGGVRTRQHPIPFLWQERSAPGHDGAVVVGRIDRVWTDGGMLWGEGPFGTDQNAQDAARFLASGMANGISVDPDEISFVMDPDSDQVLFTDWRLAAATMVGIQAFDEARIEPIYGYVPAEVEQVEEVQETNVLLAAGLPGHVYDSGWFADPQLSQHTPVTITDDGRIFGHLAEWDVCHVGIGDVCTVAPPSQTSYAYFHTGEIRTDAGRLAVGRITLAGGHADTRLGYRPASNHYDDTTTAVAVVRAGEDQFGIWVAGSVLPEASGEQVDALMRSPLSGDWRKIGGNLELMAALAVNTAGFPVLREREKELVQTYSLISGAQVDGEQVSLIITGSTPMRESLLVGFDYEKAADAIVAAMETQQRREGRRAVALARAGRDVQGRYAAVMQRIGG